MQSAAQRRRNGVKLRNSTLSINTYFSQIDDLLQPFETNLFVFLCCFIKVKAK